MAATKKPSTPFVGFYAKSQAQLLRFQRAARREKRSLSDWARATLDREARKEIQS